MRKKLAVIAIAGLLNCIVLGLFANKPIGFAANVRQVTAIAEAPARISLEGVKERMRSYCTLDSDKPITEPIEVAEETRAKALEVVPEVVISYDAFTPTNFTAEQLEVVAQGRGQALADMEASYGVSAIFCLAVGHVESNWCITSNQHNYWGITSANGGYRAWESLYEAIQGFGAYMDQSMYRGKSIEAIAQIYCPPNPAWPGDVKSTMAGYYSEIERSHL